MSALKALDIELMHWRNADLVPGIWWRDDDAVKVTPQLRRLLQLAITHQFPVLLAVIPALTNQQFANFVNREKLLSAATHGFGHYNHADPGSKKTELTENSSGRTTADVVGELEKSREIMNALFAGKSCQILVPPWNRISESVLRELPMAGFKLLSTFAENRPETSMCQINCHIDLMEWGAERKGKPPKTVLLELITCLQLRRVSADPTEPIGILSHHLVHDENAWETSRVLMETIALQTHITVLSSDDFLTAV